MKTKLKKQKGITLIALIITIIIMLILVGVTVSVVINSDIIGSSKKAAKDWEKEQEKESKLGNIEVGGTEYSSITQYTNSLTGHVWTRTGDTIKCTKHPEEVFTIGEKVNYVATGLTNSEDLKTDETTKEKYVVSLKTVNGYQKGYRP